MTEIPDNAIDIFLQPGEFYFGDKQTRLRTMLGSCVAITIWHPRLHIGGMCHYVLPKRPSHRVSDALNGQYAEDVMQMFMRELKKTNTKPSEYKAKLFGGGNMFPKLKNKTKLRGVSQQNVDFGRFVMTQYGFKVGAEDMGGSGRRNIVFELWNGDVWVKRAKSNF